jgi:uncharacterized protein (TIGR00369 family)
MTDRSRSYSWADPNVLAEAVRTLSGLEVLQKIADRSLPQPAMGATAGFHLVEVEEGRAVFEGRWTDFIINPAGTVHGGWYGIILDSCMGCAVHSTLPQGTAYTTLEYKVNITRAITEATGPVRAEGRVIHRGRRSATAEGKITDAAGKVYGHASTTCMIL